RGIGVSYEKSNATFTAKVRKKAILSAGALQSAKLLGLSGIGDCRLLSKFGIPSVYHNPNVGEDHQTHIMLPLGFVVNRGITTTDDFANNPAAFQAAMDEYIQSRSGSFTTVNGGESMLTLLRLGGSIYSLENQTIYKTFEVHHTQFTSQYAMLWQALSTNDTVAQVISIAGGIFPQSCNDISRSFFASSADRHNYYTLLGVLQHPFLRGSVHIQFPNPHIHPRLDPKYLSHSLGLALTKSMVMYTQSPAATPPLATLLPANGTMFQQTGYGFYRLTNENAEGFIRETVLAAFYHSGNCAMLPREKGGVVDARFRVYGVDGLRVVDASVFTSVSQATINSIVIAVAERAADYAKGDYGH
ncbi:GMC oxidoreductase-domain-containing protein, partial [Podospora didyma]